MQRIFFWTLFLKNKYEMGTCIISADQIVFILYFEGGIRIALIDLLPVLIPAWDCDVVETRHKEYVDGC